MAKEENRTLGDYVAVAISPALIMGLVGSLVLFLLEVLYQGEYDTRLRTILFSFVFAIVLISRISMSPLAPRAWLYGLVLGILVWIGMQEFVEYPPEAVLTPYRWLVNLGLMGLIWWCAHRLTYDCTFLDEDQPASSRGLLEDAGLDLDAKPDPDDADADGKPRRRRNRKKKPQSGLEGWWERYQQYREDQKHKPHKPGVWVVYFSLAALPIFGLGQALIPLDKEERRRKAFWYMVIYVASGLSLLGTTCYLGMRRYLRQRRIQMPLAMTGVWLVTGGSLILVLLLVGALLPRPDAEYFDVGQLAWSKKLNASSYAVERDSPGKGQGSGGAEGTDKDKDAASGESGSRDDRSQAETAGKKGAGSSGDSAQSSGGKSEQKGQGQSGQNKSGQSGENQSGGQKAENKSGDQKGENQSGGQKGESRSGDKKGDNESSDQKSGKAEKGNERTDGKGRSQQRTGGRQTPNRGGMRSGNPEEQQSNQGSKPRAGGGRSGPQNVLPQFLQAPLRKIGPILKVIVFIVGGLIVLFVVLKAVLTFLANFTGWAKNLLESLRKLWESLFGWLQPREKIREATLDPEIERPVVPFSAYRNPFTAGLASRWSPAELLRYSFDALQALAREGGYGRHDGETPLEFSNRLGDELPSLERDLRQLATLYSLACYARADLPKSVRDHLRDFWNRLDAHVESPASA